MIPAHRLLRIKQHLFLFFLKLFDVLLALVLLSLTWNTERHWEFLISFLLVLLMHCMCVYAEKKKSFKYARNAEIIIIVMLVVSLIIFLTLPLISLKSQRSRIPSKSTYLSGENSTDSYSPCAIKTYENGLFDGYVFQLILAFIIISVYIEHLRIENLLYEWSVFKAAAVVVAEAETFV